MKFCIPAPYKAPFSSVPGIHAYLPGTTSCSVKVYPTAVVLYENGKKCVEIELCNLGVVQKWQTFFDLLHRRIQVEGIGRTGFFRFWIEVGDSSIFMISCKGMLQARINGENVQLNPKERISLFATPCAISPFPSKRLSLGCSKAPNWDRISLSPTMEEILPIWYQLAEAQNSSLSSDTMLGKLLQEPAKEGFESLFRSGISGFFVPEEQPYMGYELSSYQKGLNNIHSYVVSAIRNMFIREGKKVDLLPLLPKQFLSGRLLREKLASGHMINIEWRKGRLWRVFLEAVCDDQLTISSRGAEKCCFHVSGEKKSHLLSNPLDIKAKSSYLLDNFS